MRRIGRLYERITEYDNLLQAFHAAALGKRHKPDVISFTNDLHRQLGEIRDEFAEERVRLGTYRFFTVFEPKKRFICAASFRERVIHHAVINVAGEQLQRPLIDQCFACRKGKGQHRAAQLAQTYAQRYGYFLKMDIRKYFDSIVHAEVLRQLRCLFKDPKLIRFFERLLDTYHTVARHGLPIGNLTSQYLANLYLSPLDHLVKQELRCPAYLRYMDDFMLWGTRSELRYYRRAIVDFLFERLGLEVKGDGFINRASHGCDFLGFRIFPDQVRLSRNSKHRLRRRERVMEKNFLNGTLGELELQQRITSIYTFAASADTLALRRSEAQKSILTEYYA